MRQRPRVQHVVVSKHRHERFRPAYAVVRIDGYDIAGVPKESLITVKEVWLSPEQAESEVVRLNALNADKSAHYFMQYTRLQRDG
jgi:hypothetical protein